MGKQCANCAITKLKKEEDNIMPSMPQEYTPEMTQNFYESLSRPIEERTRLNVGKARSEALARGMEGDPFESLGVASARNQGAQQLGDLWSGISMQGADKARQERMTKEGRDWQTTENAEAREWQSQEADAGRAFQEKMTQTNYDNSVGMLNRNNRNAYQSEIWNTLAGIGKGAAMSAF